MFMLMFVCLFLWLFYLCLPKSFHHDRCHAFCSPLQASSPARCAVHCLYFCWIVSSDSICRETSLTHVFRQLPLTRILLAIWVYFIIKMYYQSCTIEHNKTDTIYNAYIYIPTKCIPRKVCSWYFEEICFALILCVHFIHALLMVFKRPHACCWCKRRRCNDPHWSI